MSKRKRRVMPVEVPQGGLILPGAHVLADPEVMVGVCSTCDERFYRGQEKDWERHVYRCAMDNLGEIMAAREEQKKRMAIFSESWNPDVDEHLRKVGERMIAEGRMEMHKNERVENE